MLVRPRETENMKMMRTRMKMKRQMAMKVPTGHRMRRKTKMRILIKKRKMRMRMKKKLWLWGPSMYFSFPHQEVYDLYVTIVGYRSRWYGIAATTRCQTLRGLWRMIKREM
jgi:hypothetical protein